MLNTLGALFKKNSQKFNIIEKVLADQSRILSFIAFVSVIHARTHIADGTVMNKYHQCEVGTACLGSNVSRLRIFG